jgi:hypothetical protein
VVLTTANERAVEGLDIERNVGLYLGQHTPTARYSSFDYCYNYFQGFREADRLGDLADEAHLQASCLQLGFFLASWGMLRGSAELLQRSARTYVPVINAIVAAPRELWAIDANDYSDDNIGALLNYAQTLRRSLHKGASNTLVTKVMLGVFGCVPAFDDNFKRGFRASTFGPKALKRIRDFYRENDEVIELNRVPTLDFDAGQPTQRFYSRAKVIDMIFFIEGE